MCLSTHKAAHGDQQLPLASNCLARKAKKKNVRALDMHEVAVFPLWIPPRVRAILGALAGGTALNVHPARCVKCAVKEKVNKPLVICLKRGKRDIYK